MRLVRWGGALAVAVSLGLLVLVLVRDAGLNVLNGWTIFLGVGAGLAVILRPQPVIAVAAVSALVLAMLPALIGGIGLLYLAPVGLILGGAGALRGTAASTPAS
ncbi:MAG: hypothetical protein ABIZ57_10765 [Candidatus Limnocylindria bacterium]